MAESGRIGRNGEIDETGSSKLQIPDGIRGVEDPEALQEERTFVSAVFDTVGALVIVLDHEGRIVRFNRACQLISGFSIDEARGAFIRDSSWMCEMPRSFEV